VSVEVGGRIRPQDVNSPQGAFCCACGRTAAEEVRHIGLFPYSGCVQATVTLLLVAVGSLMGAVRCDGRSNPAVALRQCTTVH
jgi:hypothetical protein